MLGTCYGGPDTFTTRSSICCGSALTQSFTSGKKLSGTDCRTKLLKNSVCFTIMLGTRSGPVHFRIISGTCCGAALSKTSEYFTIMSGISCRTVLSNNIVTFIITFVIMSGTCNCPNLAKSLSVIIRIIVGKCCRATHLKKFFGLIVWFDRFIIMLGPCCGHEIFRIMSGTSGTTGGSLLSNSLVYFRIMLGTCSGPEHLKVFNCSITMLCYGCGHVVSVLFFMCQVLWWNDFRLKICDK